MQLTRKIPTLLKRLTPPLLERMVQKTVYPVRRVRATRRLQGQRRLHLACGKNVLQGWANIDYDDNNGVIGWDLSRGLPIVASSTIDLIYCEHFIEHISLQEARVFLADCYRVLQSGGVLRLSTPSLEMLVSEYQAGRILEWRDVGWNPATPCRMLNEGFRLWGHQFVYDRDELVQLLQEVGFCNVIQVAWGESTTPLLRGLECRPYHGEHIFEAEKST